MMQFSVQSKFGDHLSGISLKNSWHVELHLAFNGENAPQSRGFVACVACGGRQNEYIIFLCYFNYFQLVMSMYILCGHQAKVVVAQL